MRPNWCKTYRATKFHYFKSGAYVSLCGKKVLGPQSLECWKEKPELKDSICLECRKIIRRNSKPKETYLRNPNDASHRQPWGNTPMDWTDRELGRTPLEVVKDLIAQDRTLVRLEPGDATRYELMLVQHASAVNILTVIQLRREFFDVGGGFSFVFDGRWIHHFDLVQQPGYSTISDYTKAVMRFYCNLLIQALMEYTERGE